MDKKCVAKTRNGDACRAPAGPNGLCYLHADPDRAKTLGQRGGLGNRRPPAVDLDVPDKIGLAELRDLEVKTVRCFVAGELTSAQANTLFQMYNSIFRIIPGIDLEDRVTALEAAFDDQGTRLVGQRTSMSSRSTKAVASPGGDRGQNITDPLTADASDRSEHRKSNEDSDR
jgi:hypothetical protein